MTSSFCTTRGGSFGKGGYLEKNAQHVGMVAVKAREECFYASLEYATTWKKLGNHNMLDRLNGRKVFPTVRLPIYFSCVPHLS